MEKMKSYRGHIVGSVEIADCVTSSASPWFFGKFGFVLVNPIAFPRPVLCRGSLGLFTVPEEVSDVIAFMESLSILSVPI